MGYTPHVLVVGGGVLGTAIARDLAIRGLEVTLVEQGTLTAGTTGRIHGVLYSGARFALTDQAGAKRCRAESRVLREIADHCIQPSAAVITPGDTDRFGEYLAACERCEIPFQELSDTDRADLGVEGKQAIRVPEAAVDPFELTLSNAAGAREFGATIETGASVREIRFDGDRVAGVTVEYDPSPGTPPAPTREDADGANSTGDEAATAPSGDEQADGDSPESGTQRAEIPGEVQREFPGASEDDSPERGDRETIEADFVVNATGARADEIAALAGIDLPLSRTRGRMLVLDEEPEWTVTRYDPELPLTLSPFWGNAVLGPVADRGPVEDAIDELSSVYPSVEASTVLRSYSGVWTQHESSSGHPYGPGATMVDHEKYDDQWGMMSVVGGTLTTHRLVAKQVVDRICREFGISRDCMTDELPLPEITGSTESTSSPSLLARSIPSSDDGANPVLCESQSVKKEAVEAALDGDDVRGTDLTDVRIRTGATMGACQGGRCGHRIAAQLYPEHDAETVEHSLEGLLAGRWQGRRKTLWGGQLAAAVDDYEFHAAVLNRDTPDQELELDTFDGGPESENDERPMVCEAVVYE